MFIETIVYKRTFSYVKNYCLKYNIYQSYLKAKFTSVTIRLKTLKQNLKNIIYISDRYLSTLDLNSFTVLELTT